MIQGIDVAEKAFIGTMDAVDNGKRIIVHEGGSGSAKTWSIFIYLLQLALQKRKKPLSITIAREKLTWIKHTLLSDLEKITKEYNIKIEPEINIKRHDQVYYINGSEFAFFGLDYPQKLHGRRQDIFWVNEAMEVSKKYFDQLEMRTKWFGLVDYNPADDEHWVFTLEKRDDVEFIRSTMLDNPFLPQAVIKSIRRYEPTEENIKNGTADEYMWQVYGLGKRARLQGAVFQWKKVRDIPEDAKLLGYGLDYGYTNDPTAVLAMYMYQNEVYLDELIYQAGLNNKDIYNMLTELKINIDYEIYADSAEPKSNDELAGYGLNIVPAEKGQGSVNFGIDLLKQYNVYYTERSINIDKESRKYKWREDRAGNRLNTPIDKFNHLMDAARYVAMSVLSYEREMTEDDFEMV